MVEESLKYEGLIQATVDANKEHQIALVQFAESLSNELEELDTLLNTAIDTDGEDDETVFDVQIPGAQKLSGPCRVSEFLNPDSPFFEDASRRMNYLKNTTHHPMRARELEELATAVRSDNERLRAFEIQRTGISSIDVENNTEGLNWNFIAEKVSDTGKIRRTASECRIKWLGDRHPKFNHSEWSASEIENLKRLVTEQKEKNGGKIDWVYISDTLPTTRTPLDCMRHGVPRPRHTWTEEFDRKLINAVQKYGTNNWSVVATVVSGDATASQCQGRYFRSLDPSVKRGAWSESELQRLISAVASYGNSWMEIAACLPGRTNEQCRERWADHLATPTSQTQWTQKDDETLLMTFRETGRRWKKISIKVGNGSTGPQCRLRYEKLMKQRTSQSVPSEAAQPGSPTASSEPFVSVSSQMEPPHPNDVSGSLGNPDCTEETGNRVRLPKRKSLRKS